PLYAMSSAIDMLSGEMNTFESGPAESAIARNTLNANALLTRTSSVSAGVSERGNPFVLFAVGSPQAASRVTMNSGNKNTSFILFFPLSFSPGLRARARHEVRPVRAHFEPSAPSQGAMQKPHVRVIIYRGPHT